MVLAAASLSCSPAMLVKLFRFNAYSRFPLRVAALYEVRWRKRVDIDGSKALFGTQTPCRFLILCVPIQSRELEQSQRHRLAYGLAITDGERDILVTLIEKCIRNEIFPGTRSKADKRSVFVIATPKIENRSYLSCRRCHTNTCRRS